MTQRHLQMFTEYAQFMSQLNNRKGHPSARLLYLFMLETMHDLLSKESQEVLVY